MQQAQGSTAPSWSNRPSISKQHFKLSLLDPDQLSANFPDNLSISSPGMTMSKDAGDDDNNNNGTPLSTVSQVSAFASHHCRLSKFIETNPCAWSSQADAAFQVNNVANERERYHVVINHLDADALEVISDISTNPPKEEKATRLTAKDQLTPVADELLETSPSADVMAASPHAKYTVLQAPDPSVTEMAEFRHAVTQLIGINRQMVHSLEEIQHPSRGRATPRSELRPNQVDSGAPGFCRFHRKFGDQAYHCRSPCSFASQRSQTEN